MAKTYKKQNIISRFFKDNKSKQRVLFGTLDYDTDIEYLNYLRELTPEQAVITLVAAAVFAQSKGIYSFEESEAVITSIRKLTLFKETKPKDDNIKP